MLVCKTGVIFFRVFSGDPGHPTGVERETGAEEEGAECSTCLVLHAQFALAFAGLGGKT